MKKYLVVGLGVAALTLATSACGDDDDSAAGDDTSQNSDGGTATTSATEGNQGIGVVQDFDLPSGIEISEPLTGTPEEGIRVAWLECSVPACTAYSPGMQDATEALGWELVTIPFDHADPGPGFQQAIDAGVDYITVTAVSAALVEEELDAARDSGIGIYELFGVDEPEPESNNIYIQAGGPDYFASQGTALADWVVEDSGGSANAVVMNIRDLAILNYAEDAIAATLAEDCEGCEVAANPLTFENLAAGEIPQIVASYLQSNPEVEYVLFPFSDVSLGVSETLASAGFDDVKVAGVNGSPTNMEAIVAGSEAAWTTQATDYFSWIAIDAMARNSVGMELDEDYLETISVVPTFVVSSPELAETILSEYDGYWPGPDGFREALLDLWGV